MQTDGQTVYRVDYLLLYQLGTEGVHRRQSLYKVSKEPKKQTA